MREERISKLDTILDMVDKKIDERKKQLEQIQDPQHSFLKEFDDILGSTIEPTMRKIGECLKQRGHDYHLNLVPYDNPEAKPIIKFTIYPSMVEKSKYDFMNTPYVTFWPNLIKKTVAVSSRTATPFSDGSAGLRAEYSIKQICSDIVEKEILRAVKEIFE